MRIGRGIGVVLGAGALVLGLTPAAGAAAQAGQYRLSIVPHDGAAPRTVTLTCDPVGGTHPDAKAACADLALADGEIAKIPPAAGGCTGLYDPVTAQASGTWNGRPVSYRQVFTNDGCANMATGGNVFAF
jgi:hypothetical protein